MKSKLILFFFAASVLLTLLSVTAPDPDPAGPGTAGREDIGAAAAVALFDRGQKLFASSVETLCSAIRSLSTDTATLTKARECLKDCRRRYKRIAFFNSYFFPSETALYNAPPVYEVEEPELEIVEPMGLQQIEALLFENDVLDRKPELLMQATAMYESAADLGSLLYGFRATDRQVLESVRLELIRIMTLYISGYDAPSLKTGIIEALESSKTLQQVLEPYFQSGKDHGRPLAELLETSVQYLERNQDFDSFDRMEYLTRFGLPLQEQLGLFIREEGFELNTSAYLNYDAPHLFSPGFLRVWDTLPQGVDTRELAALGKQLFSDKRLSGTMTVSCATCHRPEHYFSDLTARSPSLVEDSVLKRNTPSLLYAGRQHFQFWDGRAPSLADQIMTVLFDPLEMGADERWLRERIIRNPGYRATFERLFAGRPEKNDPAGMIALAIATYVGGLAPENAAFDRYLEGDPDAMSPEQVKGFNLFMGKAQCGTCHFPPYFNSLLPPLYGVSEVEVLGTTLNDDFEAPEYDMDMGRFDLYQIQYYERAFKTPTVRNSEMTAPYMHNGSFSTLESVVDFYNKGGGSGLGLEIPGQTLSAEPLNLTEEECAQVVAFLQALTDEPIDQFKLTSDY